MGVAEGTLGPCHIVDYWKKKNFYMLYIVALGLPWWLSGKESPWQCKRLRFNPWVGKIPWRRKWLHTQVFLPWESHGQRSLTWGRKDSDTTERLRTQWNFFFFWKLFYMQIEFRKPELGHCGWRWGQEYPGAPPGLPANPKKATYPVGWHLLQEACTVRDMYHV